MILLGPIERNKSIDYDGRIRDGQSGYTDILPLKGPCFVRSIFAGVESFAGRNLTISQIDAILDTLGINPSNLTENWSVNIEPKDVVKLALSELGINSKNYKIRWANQGRVGFEDIKASATFSVRATTTTNGIGGNEVGHYQEGGPDGTFRFDPVSGTSDGGRTYIPSGNYYFSIQLKGIRSFK